MKIKIIISLFLCAPVFSFAALNISGKVKYTTLTPSKTSGLEAVYVVENAADAVLSYTATSASAASRVKWKKFSSLGGGYAEDILSVNVEGNKSSIRPFSSDMGYIVEVDGRQTAYWLVNYANHLPTLTSVTISDDSDCDRVSFTSAGTFGRMLYYSINGAPIEIDRGIEVKFKTLEINDSESPEGAVWKEVEAVKDLAYIDGPFSVEAPTCNTKFTVTGDRFLTEWAEPVRFETSYFTTRRVDARTWAVQATRDISNEQNSATSGLGGSAPCEITFTAIPTDAAVFHEWQFSNTEDFTDVIYRFNEDEVKYTFEEYGTTYARYVCADASGECEYVGDVYSIMVGESKLLCPNAFSPANQDGVNDEWKVSYSSLVSYECHIFSRWGKEVFSSRNPAEGWDGRVGGKFVSSGVFFYVITAEGADGHHYKLSGDINIINSKLNPNASSSTE